MVVKGAAAPLLKDCSMVVKGDGSMVVKGNCSMVVKGLQHDC